MGLFGGGSREEGDKTHEWNWWKDDRDDNIRHSESFDVDKDGNVTNFHYHQEDERDGSSISYNYHTGQWEGIDDK